MHLQSMMNRKQSLRNKPMIKYHKNMQQTERRALHAVVQLKQRCCCVSLLKSHLSMGATPQIHHLYPKTPLKQNKSKELLPMHSKHTH